jgi:outer membrane receptor protein involved in Fe transport
MNRLRLPLLLVLSGFLLISPSLIFAQAVSGVVVNESTREPVEFVSVMLRKTADSSLVAGSGTDKKGKFQFANIAPGEFYVQLNLIGYEAKKLPSFSISAKHPKVSLGTILLAEKAVSLDEVLITSQRALINSEIDRKVYNVSQDIMAKTGSASDLLQNVPSIEVDIDGNVSLRGSSNVLILINGQTSPLMGKSRAEVLQQLPANTIEKIEVIDNPSAKYRPDGTSGIINIVLKKNTVLGLNGTVAANAGVSDRYNGNARLNYNSGDVNIYGNFSLRQDTRTRTNADLRTQVDTLMTTTHYLQNLASHYRPVATIGGLGFDYAPDLSDKFGLAGTYFYNHFTRNDVAATVLRDANSVVTSNYDRDRYDPEYEKEYGFTSFYQHNFPGKAHTLRLDVKSSNAPEQEDNHYSTVYYTPTAANEYDNTLLKQGERQTEVTLDYSNPLAEHSTFEAGYAGEFNQYTFDLHAENMDPLQGQFVTDLTKTNRFVYDENIQAVYATYENKFGAFSFLAGLRTEAARTQSNLVAQDSVIPGKYFTLYPSVHLSYELNEAAELQLNYSKRTRRPETDDMNPFPEYQDPRTISAGNPHLLPEFIHSIELGFKVQNDYISILPSIYYRYTYNQFTTVLQALNDSTVLRTHTNLSSGRALGTSLILSGSVSNYLTSNLSVDVFRNQIDASNLGYSSSKSVLSWSGVLTCNVNVARGTMVQLNAKYNSARLTPQGEYAPSHVVNVGVRQDLMANKLSLVLTAADVFKTLRREVTINTPSLTQAVVNRRDAQIVYLGLTCSFGRAPKKGKEETLQYDNGQ